jgi:signal peptidase I
MHQEITVFTLLTLTGIIIAVFRYYAFGIVEGWSMYPAFSHRDYFIVKKRNFGLDIGEVYLIKYEDRYIIKRLAQIYVSPVNGELNLYFLGDNVEDSIDSRMFGMLKPECVKGKVTKLSIWRN